MSSALVNRSLTTIRTELEFLLDSEVIDKQLYDKLINSIPAKFQNGMEKWTLQSAGIQGGNQIQEITNDLAKTNINEKPKLEKPIPPKVESTPPKESGAKPLSYCRAVYDYAPQEPNDLELRKSEKLCVLEHLSEDWWKGYKKSSPQHVGVFPSNYVEIIKEDEFNSDKERSNSEKVSEKQEYAPPEYTPANYGPGSQNNGSNYGQHNGNSQYGPGPQNSGNSQYGPGPQNNSQGFTPYGTYGPYGQQAGFNQGQQVQQQQPQQAQVQNPQDHPHLRKFGSKLGNSVILGAGMTIGSDLVNSIF